MALHHLYIYIELSYGTLKSRASLVVLVKSSYFAIKKTDEYLLAMKKLLTIILLLCATLLSAQNKSASVWQEIDTLIAKGHYTSAYEKSGQLLKKAKRKGDSHSMLKAVYKQRIAAAAYQEEDIKMSVRAYQDLIPSLKGADKSVAYMLLAIALEDYKSRHLWRNGNIQAIIQLPDLTLNDVLNVSTDDLNTWHRARFTDAKHLCYEAALKEEKTLKATKAEEYDLLIKGDQEGLRLRPTLYDVLMHTITDNIRLSDNEIESFIPEQYNLLFGTSNEFITLGLSPDTLSYELWKLCQLQCLTRHHTKTTDTAIRAHIDRKRMLSMMPLAHTESVKEAYIKGLERIAESYAYSPTEQAMFLYLLADFHKPNIYEHSDEESIERELLKAKKMELYIEQIRQIAPKSEWAKHGEELYRHATYPYLSLQCQSTILPGRENGITLTVRNAGNITYRIVPRHADESNNNFNLKEVAKRKSVGQAVREARPEYPNAYIYKEIELVLPPLNAGDYFVIATNDGKDEDDSKRNSIAAISVSNLKMTILRNEAEETYIGMVIDATTGKAVTDCEVMLMEQTNQRTHLIEHFEIDEKGHFTVPLPTGKYRNLYLKATDGESQASYTLRYTDFTEHRHWSNDKDASPVCFTFLPDRHTYEPGDTVHFSLIAYTHASERSDIKRYLPLKITLNDARHNEVATMQGVTDEWGRFSSSFAIPEDITPGHFSLQVSDTISKRNESHGIKIEAFKAPTFKAEIQRPLGTVRFGDSLRIKGTATTLTTMPVQGAKVNYEVSATKMHIFGHYPMHNANATMITGTTKTDEKGAFAIPIKIAPLQALEENTTYSYRVIAHITDITGETQTVTTRFIVGHRTKYIDFARPSLFRHGDSIRYSFRTLNDERIAEKVTLRLCKQKVPHSTEILHSIEEGREQWDDEQNFIERTVQTATDKDNYLVLSEKLPYGFYRLTATYHDGDKQYSENYYFELWGEGKGTVSSNTLYQVRRIDRHENVYKGDTAVLYMGTRHSDVYIHYYIQSENRVVDKGTLCLSDEMTALRIPIKQGWRNNLRINFVSVKENVRSIWSESFSIVNRTDMLNVQLSTIRDYLEPGEREHCSITVSDYCGNPVQAAFTLSIYDAALDTYGLNHWNISRAPEKYGQRLEIAEPYQYAWSDNTHIDAPNHSEPKYYTLPQSTREVKILYNRSPLNATRGAAKDMVAFNETTAEWLSIDNAEAEEGAARGEGTSNNNITPPIQLRKHLRHTALFVPTLYTDAQGLVNVTFTAPNLLTQWHVKGIAHTKDLRYGHINFDFITRKTLMVQPHAPRFLYEGDRCDFTAKVSNSDDKPIEVVVKLEIGAESFSQAVSIDAFSTTSVSFPIIAPEGVTSLTYRVTAQSKLHSDGEQAEIKILPRRTLVTETMALYINGKETREFVFDALQKHHSQTLEHKSLTLDIVSNPIWYAIEALQPLCTEENPSNERLFHRYYAATMGTYLITHFPEIEGYTDFYRPDSLIALSEELIAHLAANQGTDGGWAWINGFNSDRITTQLILKGLGELEAMDCISIAQNNTLYTMVKHGILFLDAIFYDSYIQKKRKSKTLDKDVLNYLYVRSMFPEIPFGTTPNTAYHHYKKLLLANKASYGTLSQKAIKMLTLIRLTERTKAADIAKVALESALFDNEMGLYWRDNTNDWNSNTIATQAMLIEAFYRLNQPEDIVGRMQQWLLKQKQTTHWHNSIATAQAVHALVATASSPSITKRNDTSKEQPIKVKVGGKTISTTSEDSIENKHIGLIRQQWAPEDITSKMAMTSLEKVTPGISWGSMTWQYYENADKVKASGNGLSLKTTYYKVESGIGADRLLHINENMPLKKGDRIRVRLHFTADRAMNYVELHLHRPAALEPTTTHSGYTYSNGLAYYKSTENTQTVFYFYHLDKGEYTIDYDLWVSQAGHFTCGVSTIQCMYAPVFIATTTARQINVGDNSSVSR